MVRDMKETLKEQGYTLTYTKCLDTPAILACRYRDDPVIAITYAIRDENDISYSRT
jgi:hypothetical protein